MQNVKALDKIADAASPSSSPPSSGDDIVKKLRQLGAANAYMTAGSTTPTFEYNSRKTPRVTSSRDQMTFNCAQNEKPFQATLVAEKYLLLDQVEGSSLYRCMDVNTQEELVCKVRKTIDYYSLYCVECGQIFFIYNP